MQKAKVFYFFAVLVMAVCTSNALYAQPTLGDAPKAPTNISGLPDGGLRPLFVTGGFNVNTSSREQVREFYNAIYTASFGTLIDSTANMADCFPGTNSTAFQEAVLLRINWFRAMAGLPAAVTFDSDENTEDQSGALMMSANDQLQHTGIPPTWSCFSIDGTNAAANSNLALGYDGPDAITGYIWDFGTNNYEVGHRRWILYPQTQVMGTGDVLQQNSFNPANATWVFDANYGGPRPATRTPYVSWPPAGYVPYRVVYPQWSFALSNADLSAATVNMQSNGVSIPVSIQPYQTGYGENTLVWYPTNLDPTVSSTAFPFNGTDTVFTVAVSNIITSEGAESFSYIVTVFDPAVPGAGYVPIIISGTNRPTINANNAYTCTPVVNPNITGYQWLVAQNTNGNFFDGAENGLVNFTAVTTSGYSVITNLAGESGDFCFYLAMPTPASDQILQLSELLFPETNTMVKFNSLLGYATTNQIAEVLASTNGGTVWQDIYSQTGSGGAGESSFITQSLSLSNYAGTPVLLRFNYHFNTSGSGSYYSQTLTDPPVGWFLDNIVVTNTLQLINLVTNSTVSTNFTFTPAQATNYDLLAYALIFNQFPLDWGPIKQVAAIVGSPVIALGVPIVSGNQVLLNFTINTGTASTFHLLQANQLGGSWLTNANASLTTNTLGSSYRFTTTNGSTMRFYRVQTP